MKIQITLHTGGTILTDEIRPEKSDFSYYRGNGKWDIIAQAAVFSISLVPA